MKNNTAQQNIDCHRIFKYTKALAVCEGWICNYRIKISGLLWKMLEIFTSFYSQGGVVYLISCTCSHVNHFKHLKIDCMNGALWVATISSHFGPRPAQPSWWSSPSWPWTWDICPGRGTWLLLSHLQVKPEVKLSTCPVTHTQRTLTWLVTRAATEEVPLLVAPPGGTTQPW